MKYLFIIIFFFFTKNVKGQSCGSLGQNPSSAFPACGITSFSQSNVPICDNGVLFVPGCTGGGTTYTAKNPFWYKFTCYQTGTLNFTITPNVPGDDYDWQLYDITGQDPNVVFTNNAVVVTGNWAGSPGATGTSASGVNFIQCSSGYTAGAPTFALSPTIVQGRNYLLMVSHYDNTQTGYSINFGGGTGSITDPIDPILKSANAPCDGTEIRVKLNKKIRCNSLATDGTDFEVVDASGNIVNAISAIAEDCTSNFDFDSLSVFMPTAFIPGTYSLRLKIGSDGKTLQDNCDKLIPVGNLVQFTVFPLFPTPMDSLTKPKCEPDSLVLFFRKNIKCSSIEPTGSDFAITGPYPVTIVSATATCVRGGSNKIVLKLSAPMQVAGNFLVNLKVGIDGNTLIDECDRETPLPDDVAFVIKDTVNANFRETINYTCKLNTVNYFHNGANTVNSWLWSFGSAPNSNLQNPVITYTNFEPKITTLIVSNGVCSDTASKQIIFENYLKADFDVTDIICPNKPAAFKNNSVGRNLTYQWTFGNGNVSSATNPAAQTFVPLLYDDYDARPRLIITNDFGCDDTTYRNVKVVFSCFISVPTAFTPNGDGKNDFLYPLKAYKSSSLSFSVYNRFGQRVFYSNDWQQKWNGKFKGIPQDAGTYVWTLDYINLESNKRVVEKGTTILIR
jgi:gliding motility-associated-like protein